MTAIFWHYLLKPIYREKKKKFSLTEPGRESDTSCTRWKSKPGEFLAWTWSLVCVEPVQKYFPKSLHPGRLKKHTKIYRWSELFIFKISNLLANLEILKRIVWITCRFSYVFSAFPGGAILENIFVQVLHILNFMFKPKTHHFGFSSGTWCMAFSPRLC